MKQYSNFQITIKKRINKPCEYVASCGCLSKTKCLKTLLASEFQNEVNDGTSNKDETPDNLTFVGSFTQHVLVVRRVMLIDQGWG